MTAPSDLNWFKSTHSGGSGTECVECAFEEDGTVIRDSKRLDSPVVHIGARPWRTFIRSLAHGAPRAPR